MLSTLQLLSAGGSTESFRVPQDAARDTIGALRALGYQSAIYGALAMYYRVPLELSPRAPEICVYVLTEVDVSWIGILLLMLDRHFYNYDTIDGALYYRYGDTHGARPSQATCRVRLSNTLTGYKPSHIDAQWNITITRLPSISTHYTLYEFLSVWAACAPGSEKERLYTKLVNREAGILTNRHATPASRMKREIADFTDDGVKAFTDLIERRLARASNRDLRAYLADFREMRRPGADGPSSDLPK